MSKQDNGDRVWDIIEKVGVCMLTTQAAGRLRSRPIEARPDRKAGLIFAVTDVHSAKQDEIEAVPDIGLVFIDAKARAYLSIAARARVMRDIAKIAQVWIKSDAVWWPGGPSDPNVCLDGCAVSALKRVGAANRMTCCLYRPIRMRLGFQPSCAKRSYAFCTASLP